MSSGQQLQNYFPLGSCWYGEGPGENRFFQIISYKSKKIEMIELFPIISHQNSLWDTTFRINPLTPNRGNVILAVPKVNNHQQPVLYNKKIYMKSFPINQPIRFEDLPRVLPNEKYQNLF